MSSLGYLVIIIAPREGRASIKRLTWALQVLEQRLGSYQDLLVATERALQEARTHEVPARHPPAVGADLEHIAGT